MAIITFISATFTWGQKLLALSFRHTAALHSIDLTSQGVFQFVVGLTFKLFWLAIRLAAPFSLLVLCCYAALGVLARMLPQMNLILFSFPITILAGFAALYFLAPEFLETLERCLSEVSGELLTLVKKF